MINNHKMQDRSKITVTIAMPPLFMHVNARIAQKCIC